MTVDRPPRCRPLPPHVVESVADVDLETEDADALARNGLQLLRAALADLAD